MVPLQSIAIATAAVVGLVGCAQTPLDHSGLGTDPAAFAGSGAMPAGEADSAMAQMDVHIKAMREVHLRIMRAKTPKERGAVMAEHMKLMQDGLAMMRSMEQGGMGPGAKDTMKDMGAMDGEHAKRHAFMEKKMEMMQGMSEMMMDRMTDAPGTP